MYGHVRANQGGVLHAQASPRAFAARVRNAVRGRQSAASAALTKPRCHASYKLKCLKPNASDYDCIGGSGNGPLYTGLVKVVGRDVFRLDADHDGWGCERD